MLRLPDTQGERRAAEGLPRGEIRVLRSKYGHDAFLTEPREIADILGKSLEDVCGDVA